MMNYSKSIFLLVVIGLSMGLLAGCATNPQPDVNPLFQSVPGGKYHCYYQQDNRNVLTKGATSTVGQAAVGGALGGLLGNQFGGGTGKDIATGVGAAGGVAAGAWNAQRMKKNRLNNCLRQSGQTPSG